MLRGKDCRPGDKVKFLHEKGEGTVIRKTNEFVYVDIGDGFELPVLYNDVIIIEQASRENNHFESKESKKSVAEEADSFSQKEPAEKGREISGKTGHPGLGMYLAFAPVNQKVLIAGDIRLYLVNYTKLRGYYSITTLNINSINGEFSGRIEAASALLIATVERKDVSVFRKAMFQCLFPDTSKQGVYLPYYTMIEIKPERFMKEELYTENSAISMFSLTIQLFRIEELKLIQLALGKDAVSEIPQIPIAVLSEQQSLISKFRTEPGVAEVDLHIESIVPHHGKIDDSLKLKKQLDFFKQCLDSAIEENYSKIVFIHGVGVGVLKMEIHNILSTYENLDFRDAPLARYGIGATEVIFKKV